MRTRAWFEMVGEELRRGSRRSFMIAVGLVVGVGALIYFLALGRGAREFLTQKLIKDLPAEEITVAVPETNLGPMRLKRRSIFSSPVIIDDDTVQKIKNIEIDSDGKIIKPVKSVWRRMDAIFPASITANLFGISYGTDTAISGVDYGMVSEEVSEDKFIYNRNDQYVPALIPEALLEVYNTAFAQAQGLPGMNSSFLIGKHFEMHLGRSSVSRGGGHSTLGGVIVGLTDRGTLLGITVPIDYVVEWNRRMGREGSDTQYSSLTIQVDNARHIPAVADTLRKMGLRTRASTGLAERVSGIITMVTAGLGLLAGVILAVAGLSAWSLFRLAAWERRGVAGLWMALGASPREVKTLLLAEAVAVGLMSGIAGWILAATGGIVTNFAASRAADSIPFFPSKLVIMRPEYALLGIALAVAIAIIAAWPSASNLARTDAADILARER